MSERWNLPVLNTMTPVRDFEERFNRAIGLGGITAWTQSHRMIRQPSLLWVLTYAEVRALYKEEVAEP